MREKSSRFKGKIQLAHLTWHWLPRLLSLTQCMCSLCLILPLPLFLHNKWISMIWWKDKVQNKFDMGWRRLLRRSSSPNPLLYFLPVHLHLLSTDSTSYAYGELWSIGYILQTDYIWLQTVLANTDNTWAHKWHMQETIADVTFEQMEGTPSRQQHFLSL